MKVDLPRAEIRRLESIKNELQCDINDFLIDGYEAVALHSSSIVLDLNQACADIFGYLRDEMIFINAWKLFASESVNDLMHHLLTRSEDAYQVKARHKDGSYFIVELKGKDFEVAGQPVRSVQLKKIS